MKLTEIRDLSVINIQNSLKKEKLKYEKMKFKNKISPINNPIKIRNCRKLIARFYSELKSRSKKC